MPLRPGLENAIIPTLDSPWLQTSTPIQFRPELANTPIVRAAPHRMVYLDAGQDLPANLVAPGLPGDLLQALPPELRLMIYTKLMPMLVSGALSAPKSRGLPAILQVSKLIRHEALDPYIVAIDDAKNLISLPKTTTMVFRMRNPPAVSMFSAAQRHELETLHMTALLATGPIADTAQEDYGREAERIMNEADAFEESRVKLAMLRRAAARCTILPLSVRPKDALDTCLS